MKFVFLDSSSVGTTSLAPIQALGELTCYATSTPEQARERVADADVIITNKVRVDAALMDSAPKLKLVCESATGVNNIDIEECGRRGIPVKNVAGYSTESVAQMTWTHVLTLAASLPYYDSYIKDGGYCQSPIFTHLDMPLTELWGKTYGIVGMGAIGSRVAEIACAFGMKVVYYSTSGTSHCTKYESLPLDEFMKVCDVISVHAPLNDRTKGLIGAEQIALMKPTAIIANLGRGGIIDEAALAAAIDDARIAGAALDVFDSEPLPAASPLLHTKHPERLSLTPHVAWATKEARERLIQSVADNIKSTLF